ncbi:MAG: hypothetical protein JWO06_1783, partial [Bacteroidota bacterium]|nr:hypothetical protein [Bacteroidota bacterium]
MSRCWYFLISVCLLTLQLSVKAQYVWRHKACLPGPPVSVGTAFAVGNKGYIIAHHLTTGIRNNAFWQYDPLSDSWLEKNYYPGEGSGTASFVINDTVYAGLGIDSLGTYHTDFWRYNATADQWISIANFPGSPRYTTMCFVLNGKGYVGCGHGTGENNDFYEYNPSQNL